MATETREGGRPTPWVVGLLGLALMVGGWKLATYVPAPEGDQERQLEELRSAAKASARAGDPEGSRLARKLPWRAPPYQPQGRLVLFGGLLLFVVAGVLMYRHKPVEPEEPAEGP
ncbi:MAG TPA: hypothetical protein VFE78_13870 [Gemmataceae bacterium]|jgi:hypothetical protein|nr:hypothetical protein [Gemmataceae bacterium]